MKHPDLLVKNITVKDTPSYRIRVESWEAISPKELLAVDIIQECLDEKGKISSASTYNFHMSREEIKRLCEGLMSV